MLQVTISLCPDYRVLDNLNKDIGKKKTSPMTLIDVGRSKIAMVNI